MPASRFPVTLLRAVAWVLLGVPIVLLSWRYEVLGDPVPVFRSFGGGVSVWGGKSPLTVFRVPLFGILIGAVLETLRSSTARTSEESVRLDYEKLWTAMLGIAAVKSLIQGVELAFMSADDPGKWNAHFMAATVGVIGVGLIPVFMTGRRIYDQAKFRMGRLSNGEIMALVVIAVLYAALVVAPLVTSRIEAPVQE